MVGQWINETQARKLAADARLRAATGSTRPGPANYRDDVVLVVRVQHFELSDPAGSRVQGWSSWRVTLRHFRSCR
jgi:hypothetical protein